MFCVDAPGAAEWKCCGQSVSSRRRKVVSFSAHLPPSFRLLSDRGVRSAQNPPIGLTQLEVAMARLLTT
jgi:hypothetical protein